MRVINFLLSAILFLFSSDSSSQKYELRSFNEFETHSIDFNPNETIAVFDIDNTLMRQKHILLDENDDLGFEYSEFCKQLAQKKKMNIIKFIDFINDKIKKLFPKRYIWTEEHIPAFITTLQEKGIPVITCTASTLSEGDERLTLMNEAGIDLTKNFTNTTYYPFFYSAHYFHPGHTSSRNKATKIDEVIQTLNAERSEEKHPLIKTILFFDNREDQADRISNTLKSVSTIHSFYYTFIKHSLNVDEIYKEIKNIN